jgi:peptidyl-tRNA hydrolase
MLPDPDSLRAYVITRRDLSSIQRGVQAAHALAELSFRAGSRRDPDFRSWVDDHKTLIILSVKNEREIESFRSWIEDKGMVHAEFKEPDLGNQTTALALYPMKYKDIPREILEMPLA